MGEPFKKFKLLYKICAVNNSSWASVPGLVLVEHTIIRLLLQGPGCLLTNKNIPSQGAIPQSICEEGVVETEGCLAGGEVHSIGGWGDGMRDICAPRNKAQGLSPISRTISRMALLPAQVLP